MALEVPYRSIPDMFRQRVAATPDREALGYPTPDEGIAWLTWAGADRRVTAIAPGPIGLGVRPAERGAIPCRTARPGHRGGGPGLARRAHLHRRCARPAQGRRAGPVRLVLGGCRAVRARPAVRNRPALPVAAAGPLVRQGAGLRADPRGGTHLRRRPGGQAGGEAGPGAPDADCRRAAHLRG